MRSGIVSIPRRIRVGIVGGNPDRGWARDAHVPALKHLDHLFEILAVSARTPQVAERAARDFGAPCAFGDSLELVSCPDVDLVSVTVKVPEHRTVVLAALAAGKHVYCEWPLGRDAAEAEEMAAAVRPATHVMIGLQALSAPAVEQALGLVGSGALGRLQLMRVYSPTAGWGARAPAFYAYLQDRRNGATLATIAGGHTLAVMEALAGSLVEVDARVSILNPRVAIEGTTQVIERNCADHIVVTGLHESGCVSTLEVAGGVRHKPFLLELQGESGWLRLTGDFPGGFQAGDVALECSEAVSGQPAAGVLRGPPANVAMAYTRIAGDIQRGAFTVPDFRDACRLSRVLEAVERAALTGRTSVRD